MSQTLSLVPLGHRDTLPKLRELWAGGSGPRTLLFAGPESVGRRHVARWLAAYVNCAQQGDQPCLECESCQLLAAGAHPDVKEVSPALTTDTGRAKRNLEIRIDQLVPRKNGDPEPLGPWLLTRPRFNVRVGIIDHAEAMNASAANSLLKLLEEPPAWALIVLIASGPEAVLPTVASRSSTVRFKPLPAQELAEIPGVDPEHPALRLGQPGVLLGAAGAGNQADTDVAKDVAKDAAKALLAAVSVGLPATLEAAEEFATAVNASLAAARTPGPLDWLRHLLRDEAPTRYAAALGAIDDCEDALARYAQVPLACAVLALELRRIFN